MKNRLAWLIVILGAASVQAANARSNPGAAAAPSIEVPDGVTSTAPPPSGASTTATEKPARSRSVNAPVCIGDLAPGANIAVPEGKSVMLELARLGLPSPAWLRTVGDPEAVQVEPMASPSPRSAFFLFGKQVGSTNLMFQTRDGRCGMVEVAVGVDTGAVQAKLGQLMPAEKNIMVASAADSLVISGTVSDAIAAEKVVAIANAFVRRSGGARNAGGSGGAAGGASSGGNDSRIVNMLSIAAPQQVMLEVKVAEISKSLVDQLGVSTVAGSTRGDWVARLSSNFFKGSSAALSLAKTASNDALQLDAERKDGLVKILAEPTIMAISGQEGSFLAGGKIFIPVAQSGNGGVVTITLEEKEFGVGLRFTPTVLDGGRINLKVAPEVSELSREGIGIRTTGIAGSAILPLITTRRAATTVQLYDGQSFAIGGLIKNNVVQNIKGLPVLGEIPVLGALFRSSDFQSDRTELVFIVTPRLAKALPPDYAAPTDKYVEPTRAEFFLGGKMEGTPPPGAALRAPAVSAIPQAAQREPALAPTGFELK
jgi:pilus assembly protein CpaC